MDKRVKSDGVQSIIENDTVSIKSADFQQVQISFEILCKSSVGVVSVASCAINS